MFQPSGSTLCKVSIYLCDAWWLGNFLECKVEPGKSIMWKTVWTILMTAVFNMTMKRHFGMKLGTTQKIMSYNMIVCWKVTQWVLLLPSHPPSFYLCKVVNFGVATKNLQVEIDHFSSKVDLYIEKQQKKLYAPFFWMRLNWLKAKKPLSGCSLLFTYTYFKVKKKQLDEK